MPSSFEQLNPTRVKLTVEIGFTDLKPHLEKAYREIASQVSIPGFRKGKVPNLVIDQRFGRGMVLQEAINSILPSAYSAAVNENKVIPLGDPEIEVTKLEDGELVEFTAEVDIRPDFTVPDFKTLTATVDSLPDTEAEVESRIEMLRERFATTTAVDRAAEAGDQVTINLVASQNGEPLPHATSEGVNYTIGAEGMLEGLDEAVTGLKAGDSTTFTSTLVGGEYEGQTSDIAVEVTAVSKRELPQVNDEFAQLVSQFDTVAEMREDLVKAVVEYAKAEQISKARNLILEALVDATELELPSGVVETEITARKEQISDQLSHAGLTLERYLERVEEKKAPEEFWTELEANTIQGLKAQLILEKIADDAEIGVEQQDLSELLMRKAYENQTTPEEEAKHMMEHNHIAVWTQEIRRNKALAQVVSQAKVVDAAGNIVDISAPQTEAESEEN